MSMEEQKEDKYFHYENIGKNIVTTTIGIVLMVCSGGLVLVSQIIVLPLLNLWLMGGVFFVGLLLLFAKDKLISYVDIVVKKKTDKL